MFLITEFDRRSLNASVQARRDDGGPEPDAQLPIDSLLGQFKPGIGMNNLTYFPMGSSVNPRESQEQLRAIAGATYEHRKSHGEDQMPPLLDGLAVNLFWKAFYSFTSLSRVNEIAQPVEKTSIFRSPAHEVIGLKGALEKLKDPAAWTDKLKSDSTRDMVFLMPMARSVEKLVFTALVDRLGDPSTVYPEEIISVKIGKGDSWRVFENELQEILNDQIRRNSLALRYKHTPRGPGMPAWLRAEVKERLEDIGIDNGSYSRAGFSSGRFPDLITRSRVRLPYPAILVFSRCDRCRRVESLSCDTDKEHLKRSVAKISKSSISPWHERNCSSHSSYSEVRRYNG